MSFEAASPRPFFVCIFAEKRYLVLDNTKSTINPLIIKGDSTIETDAKHPGIVFRSYFNSSTHVPLWVKGNGNGTYTWFLGGSFFHSAGLKPVISLKLR